MMNAIKAMNDEALTFVAGGNNGDKELELKYDAPFYRVGDSVEVYVSSLHWHTIHAVVISSEKRSYGYFYIVEYDDKNVSQVTADDLERC